LQSLVVSDLSRLASPTSLASSAATASTALSSAPPHACFSPETLEPDVDLSEDDLVAIPEVDGVETGGETPSPVFLCLAGVPLAIPPIRGSGSVGGTVGGTVGAVCLIVRVAGGVRWQIGYVNV
jgi:hypothetical protein